MGLSGRSRRRRDLSARFFGVGIASMGAADAGVVRRRTSFCVVRGVVLGVMSAAHFLLCWGCALLSEQERKRAKTAQ
jgi:hypothetical protein